MSYRSKGKSNTDLVSQLKKNGVIEEALTFKAMMKVDRGNFCTAYSNPYYDSPQSIGHGVTISAPHMCLDLFVPIIKKKKDVTILDVGSGSGYLCACFAQIVSSKSKVYGIEILPKLVKQGIANIKKDKNSAGFLSSGLIDISHNDGWQGLKGKGPFDIIHVGAAAATVPQALVSQLAKGGMLVIPVGEYSQKLLQITKDKDGKVSQKKITGVRYVPLINPKNLK